MKLKGILAGTIALLALTSCGKAEAPDVGMEETKEAEISDGNPGIREATIAILNMRDAEAQKVLLDKGLSVFGQVYGYRDHPQNIL